MGFGGSAIGGAAIVGECAARGELSADVALELRGDLGGRDHLGFGAGAVLTRKFAMRSDLARCCESCCACMACASAARSLPSMSTDRSSSSPSPNALPISLPKSSCDGACDPKLTCDGA